MSIHPLPLAPLVKSTLQFTILNIKVFGLQILSLASAFPLNELATEFCPLPPWFHTYGSLTLRLSKRSFYHLHQVIQQFPFLLYWKQPSLNPPFFCFTCTNYSLGLSTAALLGTLVITILKIPSIFFPWLRTFLSWLTACLGNSHLSEKG